MTLWRFQISRKPDQLDPLGDATAESLRGFGIGFVKTVRTTRIFTVQLRDDIPDPDAATRRIADELLTDLVTEECRLFKQGRTPPTTTDALAVEVHFKPGVTDNVADSTRIALEDMGIDATSVRTARRYEFQPPPTDNDIPRILRLLGNDCIEDVIVGTRPIEPPSTPRPSPFEVRRIPLRDLDDRELESLSRDGHLFLSLAEMRTIQVHFQTAGRDPTDLELETLAQTWSEHCVHKTLKAAIEYRGAPFPTAAETQGDRSCGTGVSPVIRNKPFFRKYDNLLKDTIARATDELMRDHRGPECLSVFEDNAGVIAFDDTFGIAFKVETHNHPSAIEPYGGAATGIGGVIRDVLGCGLGAKPIANTDVFCVAPPDWPVDAVPTGVIHPKTVLKGIAAGVRDYGNRMGIPTVNGAIHFDPRYLGNPLVYCGCIGLIPRNCIRKAARPGDAIVLLGGRTGRDGIHGATFSSAELTDTHVDEFAHAVQIGNPIEEKKILDVILQARDYPCDEPHTTSIVNRQSSTINGRCLYSAITDCGAGGLSSAIGEMGEHTGADVDLETVPLKYAGLRYDEIWISEAQERMVLAVPDDNVDTLLALARSENVEATVIGRFTDTGSLLVMYNNTEVAHLDMRFLHHGLPKTTLQAEWHPRENPSPADTKTQPADYTAQLKQRLSRPTTASKHWVIRQYDHEVQGGSVVKPLVGKFHGPSDAAVIRPRLDSDRGIAIGCGLAPELGDRDPYWMAVAAIDEAVRNVVCVGGDPSQAAILDNFCWPRVDDAKSLGSLVRACQACYDVATTYGLPFISGKDSLNNEFAMNDADAVSLRALFAERWPDLAWHLDHAEHGNRLAIPPTLLISAIALVDDVNRCITAAPRLVDVSAELFYVGLHATDWQAARLDSLAHMHATVAGLIQSGAVIAAHDCSDGGLAVAVAEMAVASGLDVRYFLPAGGLTSNPFAELPSGYILQATDAAALAPAADLENVIVTRIARLLRPDGEPTFTFAAIDSPPVGRAPISHVSAAVSLAELRKAWTEPLDW